MLALTLGDMENCPDCVIAPLMARSGGQSVENFQCTPYKYTDRTRDKTLQLGLLSTNHTVFYGQYCQAYA